MQTKLHCHEWVDVVTPTTFEEVLDQATHPVEADLLALESTIYCVPLSLKPEDFETSFALLTQAEKQRAYKFRHEGAKRQFVIGHGIVHLLLKRYLKSKYQDIVFEETEHHKPYVQLPGGFKPVEYNLSHCEDYIAVALGSKSQGIDIENIRPMKDLEGISRQVFTEKEIEMVFSSNDTADQIKTFFKFWTCKEAALKANGTGFMKDPKTLEIEIKPDHSPKISRVWWSDAIEGHSLAWVENLTL